MNIAARSRSMTAALMVAVMAATSLPISAVQAGMITTDQVIETAVAKDGDAMRHDDLTASAARERIETLLARQDVRQEMLALGIDPREADARLAAMTDVELAGIAGQLDQLPAGGFSIGTALIVTFVVFGVVVLLDALGLLDVLPFVCGPGQCGTQQANVFPQQSDYPEPAAGPADDYLYQEERAPAYRRERTREDPYARRRQPRQQTEQYYEPAPVPSNRNYYEERFGTQRQIR